MAAPEGAPYELVVVGDVYGFSERESSSVTIAQQVLSNFAGRAQVTWVAAAPACVPEVCPVYGRSRSAPIAGFAAPLGDP